MRWLHSWALGLAVLLAPTLSGSQVRASAGPAALRLEASSCEEECKAAYAVDRTSCDHFAPADKRVCEQFVRARLDVCLRICDE